MGQNGGARPGSGRPKGVPDKYTLLRARMNNKMIEHIGKKLLAILDKSWELADGVYIQVPGKDGKPTKVYKRAPDGPTIKFLIEKLTGKAVQPIEGTGDTGAFIIKVVNYGDKKDNNQ